MVVNRDSISLVCKRANRSLFRSCNLLLAGVLCLCCFAAASLAGPRDRERIMVGLDLFPSLLAADRDIAAKAGPDGKLLLVLVYRDDGEDLQPFVERLRRIGTIRNYPIRIACARVPLREEEGVPPAGLFIIQRLPRSAVRQVARFGEKHRVITFSPFAGDVEEGILAGISITDRILPYVNLATMKRASIRLKPFFLRIAKVYVPAETQ